MKTLLLLAVLCVPAYAQLPAGAVSIPNIPGNACESVPDNSEALRLEGPAKKPVGADVTLCFKYEGDRSVVSYFRVRSSQTPAGPYFQWGRLPYDSTGVRFKMPPKPIYLFVTTVGTQNGVMIETKGSNQEYLVPE